MRSRTKRFRQSPWLLSMVVTATVWGGGAWLQSTTGARICSALTDFSGVCDRWGRQTFSVAGAIFDVTRAYLSAVPEACVGVTLGFALLAIGGLKDDKGIAAIVGLLGLSILASGLCGTFLVCCVLVVGGLLCAAVVAFFRGGQHYWTMAGMCYAAMAAASIPVAVLQF